MSVQLIKELRERTGAGMMDCKKALAECENNLEKAAEYLQKKSLASAAKKSARVAAEGAVGSYIHMGGKIGVLVEVNCETDFVAKNDDFQAFVKDVSMHVAAMSPQYVRPDEMPEAELAKQRGIFKAQVIEQGKPEHIADKIVDGKMKKWLSEICLLEQSFVKDPDKTVGQLQSELVGKIGEKIEVRRFVRFALGEGLEKRQDDFAAEVASMQ
ncbi:MAG: translation elongation factor Ts [Myxococcales bacterium]|nr:translation elongation factor Ts [Myxococcales bacterium]